MNDVKRDKQLCEWIRAGPEMEMQDHDGVVMWGVWFNLEDNGPPWALFASEAAAKGYAAMADRQEWDISPCIVGVKTRNNYDVPEEVA